MLRQLRAATWLLRPVLGDVAHGPAQLKFKVCHNCRLKEALDLVGTLMQFCGKRIENMRNWGTDWFADAGHLPACRRTLLAACNRCRHSTRWTSLNR